MKRKLSTLTSCTLFGVLQFFQVKYWFLDRLFQGLDSPLVYPKQDSYIYLIQIKHYLSGGGFTNNPLDFDAATHLLGVGNSFMFPILGLIGKTLNLRLDLLFLMVVFLASALTCLSVIKLLELNNKFRSGVADVLGVIICVGIFGDEFLRPSPTQWAIPLTFFVILRFIKELQTENRLRFRNAAFILLLLLLNPYYGLILFLFFVLAILTIQRRRPGLLIFGMVLMFTAGNLLELILKGASRADSVFRWGFLFTNLPGAYFPSVVILICICINRFLVNSSSFASIRNSSWNVLFVSLLIALQQNVITGVWWEPESHLGGVIYLISTIFLVSKIVELHEHIPSGSFTSRLNLLGLSASFLICFTFFTSNQRFETQISSEVRKAKSQFRLIENYSNIQPSNRKLLLPPQMYRDNSYQLFYLNSDVELFWMNEMPWFPFSNVDLFKKYYCYNTRFMHNSSLPLDSKILEVHSASNNIQFYSKWNKAFEFLNLHSRVKDFTDLENFRKHFENSRTKFSASDCFTYMSQFELVSNKPFLQE